MDKTISAHNAKHKRKKIDAIQYARIRERVRKVKEIIIIIGLGLIVVLAIVGQW